MSRPKRTTRFLPGNHPAKGMCELCRRQRLIVSDLTLEGMVIPSAVTSVRQLDAFPPYHQIRVSRGFCRPCFKILTVGGPPQVHLVSRGIKLRLTRKQAVKAANKLARDLKKMQDES